MVAPSFGLEAKNGSPSAREIHVSGRLTLADGEALWEDLKRHVPETVSELRIDLADIESLDGASAALLLAVRAQVLGRGGKVQLVGASEETAHLLELYGCPTEFPCLHDVPKTEGILEHVGWATTEFFASCKMILAFVGDLVSSFREAVRRPHTVNWRDVPRLMERAGADGAPIVLLICFLVGLIMGLQGAIQLKRFGANIFVAHLVGLSMTRELAPLMTAIVVAGRSGAAYAAELGTMRVSEEVDALRTLGLDPQRFLVFPRVLALTFVVPILTLGSDIVGCLGGLIVAITSLDLTATTYFHALQEAVGVNDVLSGLIKSAVFAMTITFVSCQRGLGTRGGAAGVGASTTGAVVTILFSLIIIDAGFTWLFNLVGL